MEWAAVNTITESFQTNYRSKTGGKAFAHAELRHFDQKRIASIETFRNFFFALFGLAVSVTFLARLSGLQDVAVYPRIIEFAQLLAQYPLHAVALMVSTIWMVHTHQLDTAENELVIFVTRLLQS